MPKARLTKSVTTKTPKKPVAKSKPAPTRAVTKLRTLPVKKQVLAAKDAPPEGAGVPVSVVDVHGATSGKVSLPRELFAATINQQLMAQAVRVYLANQRERGAATKTRGEVEGSTRKIYRQKGTGRARHGAIRAPIFVGGGIVFGPRPHDFHLDFPKKMKRRALGSALTSKLGSGDVIVVSGLSDLEPKTKYMAKTLSAIGAVKKTLLVTPGSVPGVVRAARNIQILDIVPAQELHTYSVLTNQKLVFMKEALPVLRRTFATKQ
ncbi:MAG: 50S ribosomal protein L4 [Microgenomates group bacterium GW2011_GWA2_47_8]|nr:MAG: 50S ribosomal protein L4 [Microgenomates group bacterium GW2011_GWA2_47_8]